jgi:hypothetical protein
MKMYGGVEVQLQTFLTLALDGFGIRELTSVSEVHGMSPHIPVQLQLQLQLQLLLYNKRIYIKWWQKTLTKHTNIL